MKTNSLLLAVMAGVIAITTNIASAQDTSSTQRLDLLGDPAAVSEAQRTIVITPDTKYVSVTGGETVKFIVGEKSFAWRFDVAMTVSAFELGQVAPAGLINQKVVAYITPDPMYRNP
ncbi:CzcE family metal-binding protein [Undibacterium sp. MH2W]|uniref:CzcE family metal-binding protein n=1 Tax=Undibacterium sp. MH2W TaxID=3413044 RepID=UPI003BF1A92C